MIQHFMILQLRHTSVITQSLKGICSGRETGLIDAGPLLSFGTFFLLEASIGLQHYILQHSLFQTAASLSDELFCVSLHDIRTLLA